MKNPEHDDPMELHGIECDGDPDFMIDCLAEEYLRMGWPPDEIFHLFESPCYPALHQMLRARGVEAIRRKIERVAARCGVFRFRTSERPAASDLVTIGGCEHE